MSGGGGSGSSKVEYTQSPEQQAIMQAALPLYEGLADYGQQRYFGGDPQMGAPSMSSRPPAPPTNVEQLYQYYLGRGSDPSGLQNWQNIFGNSVDASERARFLRGAQPELRERGLPSTGVDPGPGEGGVLTGQPMYDIPSPATAMPTADWWGSLAPQVKEGLYAPYVEAGQGLMESLNRGGQLGSGTAGYSGATGVAMGELAGQAAQNVGLNAWQMTSPMAMNAWNADLTRNVNAWQAGQQERMGDYQTEMDVWNRPMQTMGMMNQGMPQAYAQPQSNQWGGALSGAMMGGMGAYGMTNNPYWGAAGAAAGGLAGYFA